MGAAPLGMLRAAMSRLSTRSVSGMRDYLPPEALRRREAVRRMEGVFSRHGFLPLETPAMERLSTLLGKYGEEGDRLIYRVLHRGRRLERALERPAPEVGALADLGLRYDLTVPLARVAAEHRSRLPAVFRRYQIQPVWRADRAQRGRLREFTQCDADIVGSRSPLADAEAVIVLHAALRALGFRDFRILLNHRGLLRGLVAACGIPEAAEEPSLVLLDKMAKIGPRAVEAGLARLSGVGPDAARKLLELVSGASGEEDSPSVGREPLQRLERKLTVGPGREAASELRRLLDLLEGALGSEVRAVRFSPRLARGLSYYTGPIFEVVAAGGAGSLAGGGRYDGLVGMFQRHETPAVGFSLGMERLLLLLEEGGAAWDDLRGPQAILCPLRGVPPADALRIARGLRAAGVRLDLAVDARALGKQLARAAATGIPFALILGPDELDSGQCTVRDLQTREQETVRLEVLPNALQAASPAREERARPTRRRGPRSGAARKTVG